MRLWEQIITPPHNELIKMYYAEAEPDNEHYERIANQWANLLNQHIMGRRYLIHVLRVNPRN